MSLGVDGAVGAIPVELLLGLLVDRRAGCPGTRAVLVEAGGKLYVDGLGVRTTNTAGAPDRRTPLPADHHPSPALQSELVVAGLGGLRWSVDGHGDLEAEGINQPRQSGLRVLVVHAGSESYVIHPDSFHYWQPSVKATRPAAPRDESASGTNRCSVQPPEPARRSRFLLRQRSTDHELLTRRNWIRSRDMSEAEVRTATPEDAGVVGRLLWDFNTEFETPTPSAEEFADRFTRLLALDEVIVLLTGGAEPTGFAYLTMRPTPYFDGPLAQLEELYVRPHLRDRGIGTALLQHALELCRERNAGEMHINVDEVDTDTRRFYERHGFRNVLPGTDYQMLFYEREL
jgi:GNAT superfamily N-acetyltransferase